MTPIGVHKEPLAQLNSVRQIQVDPMRPTVVNPLKPSIQPDPELYYRAIRMLLQKGTHQGVKHRSTQNSSAAPSIFDVFGIVIVDRFDDLERLRVMQHRMLPPHIASPTKQRNKQRLLHVPKP